MPLSMAELIERSPQIRPRSAAEFRPGVFQEATLEGEDGGVIDGRARRCAGLAVTRPQQPVFHKTVRADQQLITRKGRQRAVGGIAISRWTQRQRLPPALLRLTEAVDPG